MPLSELKWIDPFSPGVSAAIVRVDRKHAATIYRLLDGTYSIYTNNYFGAVQHIDALTAQAILFELTGGGNDAA